MKLKVLVKMILQLLLLLLFSIIFLLLMLKHSTSSKLLLPPGPTKLPIIGNLHQLLVGSNSKLLLHEQLRKLAKKHGPLMHLQLGEVSTVVVSDPDMAKEVLKTNDLVFSNRPSFVANKLFSFGESSVIFAPHGEYWQRMRKLMVLEFLNPRRVRSFRSIREGEVNNIVNYISSSQGSVFNLSNKLFEFANVVIFKAAFGENIKSKQKEELIQLLEEISQIGGTNLADLYPSWKFLRHTSVFLKRRIGIVDGKINCVLDNILNNHRHNKQDVGIDHNVQDLVDVLLRIQESGEGGTFRITTNNIKGVLFDMMVGGTDTTSKTMNWAMTEIMRNPSVMKKVQSEVREAMKAKKKQQLEESDIEGLQYLKLVIKETLRLHPPFPLMQRKSSNKCTVNGYDVPDQSTVLVNLWALGRDPRYWENPEKFEPERFVESSVDFHGMHFQFLPFGLGRRVCPEIAFAGINVEMLLAALLYHFDWKLPDGENGEELDMTASFGVTAKRKKDLYVIATKVC